MKARIFMSGALMALWLAMLVPQAGVVDDAFSSPPGTYSNGSVTRGASLLLLQLPGLLTLGAICLVFRSSCDVGHTLGSDTVNSMLLLLGNAAAYMTITYWIAKRIQIVTANTARKIPLLAAGVCGLLANSILTAWMIWAEKPYYAHSLPSLSVSSLVIALMTISSLFWGSLDESQGQ